MKKSLVAILDLKTKQFGYVMTVDHLVDAERSLTDIIRRGDNNISKYPSDFVLYKIGDYDQSSGSISPVTPQIIITAEQISKSLLAQS